MTDFQKNIVIIVLIGVIGALLLYFTGVLSTSNEYLFVQNAKNGTFKPVKKSETGEYKLSLTSIFPSTYYFSERPQRISGIMKNEDFFALDNFFDKENPPNAAVVISNPESEDQDVIIVELTNPQFDSSSRRIIYTVKLIEDDSSHNFKNLVERKDASLPNRFSNVSIFIDSRVVGVNIP